MNTSRLDFVIEEAGCLLWLAPRDLGGLEPTELAQVWMGEAERDVKSLVLQGAMMPMSLYQDDGYLVRFVLGELNAQEQNEWTAHVRWKLDLSCGQILVSGILSDDFDDEYAEMQPAENNGSYWAGCYVDVPPGIYQVDVYAYPPYDLSSGWGVITDPRTFGKRADIASEKAMAYFQRTRPNELMPDWIKDEFSEEYFVSFVIHLSALTEEPAIPNFEEDGCIDWTVRKPEQCPLGILSDFEEQV